MPLPLGLYAACHALFGLVLPSQRLAVATESDPFGFFLRAHSPSQLGDSHAA